MHAHRIVRSKDEVEIMLSEQKLDFNCFIFSV